MIQDFDPANAYGLDGELILRRYGELMAKGEVACEVKRKTRRDLGFYVETEQVSEHGSGPVRPSGIYATNAPLFAFLIADTGVVVIAPTKRWREAVEHEVGVEVKQPHLHDGNPTRGRLMTYREFAIEFFGRYEPDGSGWPIPEGGWKEVDEI